MEELDLKELFNIFWEKKVEIILTIAIFAVIGIIYTVGFVTPKYTAVTKLVLATSSNVTSESANSITTTDVTLNSKLVSTYSELVKSNNIVREVIQNLKLDMTEEQMKNSIAVTSVKDTELIEIDVTHTDPVVATQIANEAAKVFMSKVSELYNISNVHVVDEAEVPSDPSNINHAKDVLIVTFIGLVIACAYVLIANMLDTTIKSKEEIESKFKLPVLAEVPLSNFTERGGK